MGDEILNILGGYEKTGRTGGFEEGLEKVKDVLRGLGLPQDKYPVVHVVGSKGKGSVVRLIEQGLLAAGKKVGSYYSPHVYRVNERIRIDGEEISDVDLRIIVEEIYETVGTELTYFEFLTVCMFKYFADQRVDYAVVEAGLGGRLDATNVVTEPKAVVLTKIELEHSDVLGDTVEDIEKEKLAVVRGGAKLFRGDNNEKLAGEVLDFLVPGQEIVGGSLPGRFEIRDGIVFDIAHTASSAKFLRERLDKKFPGEKFFFLMSFLEGKDARGVIDALVRKGDELRLLEMDVERAMSREELAEYGKVVDSDFVFPYGVQPVVCGSSRLLEKF